MRNRRLFAAAYSELIRPMPIDSPGEPDAFYAVPSGNYVPRPAGFYRRLPVVTWDLGAERWTQSRCHHVDAICRSCGWRHIEAVLAKRERQLTAELIIYAQHWYSCHANKPDIEFRWWVTADSARHTEWEKYT